MQINRPYNSRKVIIKRIKFFLCKLEKHRNPTCKFKYWKNPPKALEYFFPVRNTLNFAKLCKFAKSRPPSTKGIWTCHLKKIHHSQPSLAHLYKTISRIASLYLYSCSSLHHLSHSNSYFLPPPPSTQVDLPHFKPLQPY